MARRTGAGSGPGLCADELRARRGVPVRLTWASWGQELLLTHGKIPSLGCLGLVHRSVSDSAIHLTASIIGETGSILSRMQSTGFAGASEARVLDRVDPLATLAAKR